MAADSIHEVSSFQNPVPNDASEKALADAGRTANQAGLNYTEKSAQALRQSGILPELAIDSSTEIAYVQKNFDKLDKSHDGFITADEIDQYVKENGAKLKPEELEALRKVKEKIGKLEDLSNDEWGFENDGVTRKDLDLAQQRFKAFDYAQKNFDKLDGNGDGFISAAEIDGYIKAQGGKLNADELEKLDYLKKNISQIEDYSNDEWGFENDGITRHDLIKAKEADGTDQMAAGKPACDAVAATGDLRPALDYAGKNFDKLDADKDGFITADEIDKYTRANKDSLTPQDIANLRALKEKVGKVEDQSNDEWGWENNGITRKDIDNSKERIDALAYGKDHFDKMDGNGDGFVTADEIDAYIKARGDMPADELKKLDYLKKQVSNIEDYHNDEWGFENSGFTKHDVADALDELGSAAANSDCRKGEGATHEKPSAAHPTESPAAADKPAKPGDSKPPEETHEVKKGETLWKICRDHLSHENGAKEPSNREIMKEIAQVAKANGIQHPDLIHPGQIIKFPKHEESAKAPEQGKSPEQGKAPENKTPPEQKGADSGLDYVRKRFASIDQDGDNFITKTEIDKYIKDNEKTLTPAEVKALKRIGEKVGVLEDFSNDEFGPENDGITRQDIDIAEQRMKSIEYAQKNFGKLDGDGNGFITADEIDGYVRANGDRLTAEERANLEYLKKNVSNLEDYHNDEWGFENDGITKGDLKDALDELGSNTVGTDGNSDKLPLPPAQKREYDPKTEKVKGEDFLKESNRLFDKIDKDGDGFLSESELAQAVQSEDYKGRDAQIVAALYKGRSKIEDLSNDEWGPENDGITRKDLLKLEELRQKNAKEVEQVAIATTFLDKDDNFKKIDTDGDKFLTKDELTKALERKDLTPEERVSLQFLIDNYSDIEDAHNDEWGFENDGITRDDLSYYGDKTITEIFSTLSRTNDAQTSGTRDLFANKDNPLESIKPDAVKQGMIGDCYFESAMASLAATDPETIQKMIKDNGDGTYTVTFPGAPDEPITIKAPTEAEMGLYNQGGKDGSWACVIEKAYGAYCEKHFWRRGPFNLGGGDTPQEGADGGEIFHGRAMDLLTGRSSDTDNLTFSSDKEIADKLNAALNGPHKYPVIAGINNSLFDDTTDGGFYVAHMYSVIGFDPNGPDGGTVTIRNPWGDGDNSVRGTKKISIKEFRKNFSDVTYTI